MKYCTKCGKPIEVDESVKPEPWAAFFKCEPCRLGFRIAYQDMMSGTNVGMVIDVIHLDKKP